MSTPESLYVICRRLAMGDTLSTGQRGDNGGAFTGTELAPPSGRYADYGFSFGERVMIDAIAGLSALAAGMVGPAALRRATAAGEVQEASAPGEDRFEFGPHHEHEDGKECPYCGASVSSETSSASAREVEPGTPEARELEQLKQRDREVRAHEQAHQAAGGQHAGGATYTYQVGPDGRRYAVGGEVPIDLSAEDNPAATITKMQQVQRAALAPADPSAQDRQVAAQAARLEQEARTQLSGGSDKESASTASSGRLIDVSV